MARIAGINIPMEQRHVVIGLTHIFGIGNSRAARICDAAGVKYNVKVKDLTDAEVASLRSQVAKFAVEGDLRRRSVHEHQAPDGTWAATGVSGTARVCRCAANARAHNAPNPKDRASRP